MLCKISFIAKPCVNERRSPPVQPACSRQHISMNRPFDTNHSRSGTHCLQDSQGTNKHPANPIKISHVISNYDSINPTKITWNFYGVYWIFLCFMSCFYPLPSDKIVTKCNMTKNLHVAYNKYYNLLWKKKSCIAVLRFLENFPLCL